NKSEVFKKVAVIEYPRRGLWSIVFISSERKSEVNHMIEDAAPDTVAVFLPSTPNPTTGFLMYVPRTDVIELSMSVEEAAKLIISAGLVTPDYHSQAADLAAAAQGKQLSAAE